MIRWSNIASALLIGAFGLIAIGAQPGRVGAGYDRRAPPARPNRPLPDAVLFDWDGTIVDTIPMIYRANVVALREFGITMSREWYRERYTPDWRRSYRELGDPRGPGGRRGRTLGRGDA